MLIKPRGIIFKAMKYSETSIIAEIYTEEKGLRTYIISGVRSKKARVSAGLLQIMTLVDLIVYHRDTKDMSRIKEIKAEIIYQSIPFNVRKGAVGMFMIELAQKTIREQEENRDLFEFLHTTFKYLDETPHPISNIHLTFMLKLSAYLGFMPNGRFSEQFSFFDLRNGTFVAEPPPHTYYLKSEMSKSLNEVLLSELSNCHQLSITRPQRNELLEELITFYRLHIENFSSLNAHEVLKEVLG